MILTPQEIADALKYESAEEVPDNVMNVIAPAIDESIKTATGKNWAADKTINPLAKVTASILINIWADDIKSIGDLSDLGVISLITQLEAIALTEVSS